MAEETQAPQAEPIIIPNRSTEPPKAKKRFKIKIPKFVWFLLGALVLFGLLRYVTSSDQSNVSHSEIAPRLQVTNPNLTSASDAEAIKARDEKIGQAALGSNQFIAQGGSYNPTLTRENNDPLDSYAHNNAASAKDPSGMPTGAVGTYNPPAVSMNSTQVAEQNQLNEQLASAMKDVLKGTDRKTLAGLGTQLRSRETDQDGARASSGLPGVTMNPGHSPTAPGSSVTMVSAPGTTPIDNTKTHKVLMRTGHLLYAANDLLSNSDSSNFVQVTVQAGPYRGARLQGSFKTLGSDQLELDFKIISWKDRTYQIDAIGVNPNEPQVGMATSVNNHYLQRFGGLFLTSAMQAVGQELQQEGTSTQLSTNAGVMQTNRPRKSPLQIGLIGMGGVAQGFSGLAAQAATRKPTIILAAKTPVGVLFKTDWVDKPENNLPNAVGNGEPSPSSVSHLPYLPQQSPAITTVLESVEP